MPSQENYLNNYKKEAAMSPEANAALRQLLAATAAGVASGAGYSALANYLSHNRRYKPSEGDSLAVTPGPKVDSYSSVTTSLPVYIRSKEEKELDQKRKDLVSKAASALQTITGIPPRSGINWWQLPLGVAAATGGAFAGNAAMDVLAKKYRTYLKSRQLDDAKNEYTAAVRSLMGKSANEGSDTTAVFTDLASKCSKSATDLADIAHTGVGGLATLLALATAVSGYGTYKYLDSTSPTKKLEKAIEEKRNKQLSNLNAMPVMAYTEPVKL